jgi:hypothetical protein
LLLMPLLVVVLDHLYLDGDTWKLHCCRSRVRHVSCREHFEKCSCYGK